MNVVKRWNRVSRPMAVSFVDMGVNNPPAPTPVMGTIGADDQRCVATTAVSFVIR